MHGSMLSINLTLLALLRRVMLPSPLSSEAEHKQIVLSVHPL
jgi:hypothetical protein